MTVENSNGTGYKFRNFTLNTKEAKISFREKNGDDAKFSLFTALEGNLVRVEPFDAEWEDTIIPKIRFYLKDEEFMDVLECGRYTNFTRSVLSCLAAINTVIKLIRITPYFFEPEDSDKKILQGAVRHNGEKITRKYRKGDYPDIEIVKVGKAKKEVIDSTDRDEFFDKLIPDINSNLAEFYSMKRDEELRKDPKTNWFLPTENAKPQTINIVEPDLDADDDEMPF